MNEYKKNSFQEDLVNAEEYLRKNAEEYVSVQIIHCPGSYQEFVIESDCLRLLVQARLKVLDKQLKGE